MSSPILNDLQRTRIKQILERQFRNQFSDTVDFGIEGDSDSILSEMLEIFDEESVSLKSVEIKLGQIISRLSNTFGAESRVDHDTEIDYQDILEKLRVFEKELGKETTKMFHRESREGGESNAVGELIKPNFGTPRNKR